MAASTSTRAQHCGHQTFLGHPLGPHHNVVSLAPLDEAQVQRMIAEVSSRRALSTDVVRRVSDRAGGVWVGRRDDPFRTHPELVDRTVLARPFLQNEMNLGGVELMHVADQR